MRMAQYMAGIGVLGSLGLLGCGDPVPPAAQAGVSIHVQEYDPMDPMYGSKDCPPSRHWVNVPYDREARGPTSQKQLTDANNVVRAVNNQDGNTVSCTVAPSGSGFDVRAEANAHAESTDGTKYNPSIVRLRIPKIAEGESNARGTLGIQDHASLNSYGSSDCTFSVQGNSFGVKAGQIWGQVTCQNLTDPKALEAACFVDVGFFVFENCSK
jgi:hypothetical protein